MLSTKPLKALSEPRRQEILRLVWEGERSASDIASHFTVSRPAISQHLRVLRNAGLVEVRAQGTRRLYRANTQRLGDLAKVLEAGWHRQQSSAELAGPNAAWRPEID